MRTFQYLMPIVVTALVFMGCDPATQPEGHESESFVEEADIHAQIKAYYDHQLNLMDYEAQSGKKGANALTIAAFAHGTTVARGRSDAVSFAEAHSKAQAYLEKASGHPEAWNVGKMIGQTMLRWTIPYVAEDVRDNLKLDYVTLLVDGMSTEFPTILTTLEGVAAGSEERVIDLARKTLINTYALEKIHLDGIEEHEGWIHSAQLTDDQKRQLETHISTLRTQWPPRAVIGEGDSRSEIDIESIRARLKTLLGH